MENFPRVSDTQCRRILSAVASAVYACDEHGYLTMYNDAAAELWGRKPEIGAELWCGSYRIFYPDGTPMPLEECPMAIALREGRPVRDVEIVVERPGGERRHALPHPQPLFDESGRLVGAVNMIVDITDRKIAEQKLAQREQYLRAVLDATPECVKIVAPDGTLRYMNPSGRQIIEAEDGNDLVGASVFGLIAPESLEAYKAMHERVCGGRKEPLAFDIVGLRGTRRHMQTQAVPLAGEDGTIDHLAITRDVTDQVQAERALRESEERFRTLADNISQFAWTTDPSGAIFWYNRRWYDFTGTTFEQMKGWGWQAVHHPDHVDRVTEKFKRHIEAGEPWEDTFPIRGKDGKYRWFLSRALPIRGDEGQVVRWFGTNTDITEQREAEMALELYGYELEDRVKERTKELQESHERLRLSERMASLGTLSAGLGHDMGNLLVPVRVCIEMLENAKLDPELRDHVMEIKTSAEYLQQLAGGLRLMAIDPERGLTSESTDLWDWWSAAATLMRTAVPKGVALEADFADGCSTRMSGPALTQTVFNLVQNAGVAMSERGSGTVRISGRCEGDSAIVTIEDDGPGMTPEIRTRCMEPFFTTKPRGISTGLGLVLVAGLVRDVGGSVELWSEPGVGTRFTIRLPLGKNENACDALPKRRGRATIVMDDARLEAFVASELRALAFEIADAGEVDLAVVQRGAEANGTLGRAKRVVLVSEGGPQVDTSSEGVVSAKPSVIREALRRCVRDLQRTGDPQ